MLTISVGPPVASDSSTQATCNGNGDGRVDNTGEPMLLSVEYMELFYFWQHLSNARLVEGAFTGKASSGTNWWNPGVNIPRGIDDAGLHRKQR